MPPKQDLSNLQGGEKNIKSHLPFNLKHTNKISIQNLIMSDAMDREFSIK